jgi:hypothetical protein
MARMIPKLSNDDLAQLSSKAEARFYENCRDRLPSEIVVIYSDGWLYKDRKGKVREGETDFVILSPSLGMFAIEVKGGGVAVDGVSRQWYSVDRHGNRHSIKDPFRQASNERHALIAIVQTHVAWRKWNGTRSVIGHGVLLPDLLDAEGLVAPDRPRQIIGTGEDSLDPLRWLERLAKFWKQEGETGLGAQGVKIVESILCSPVEIRPALGLQLKRTEEERIRLTKNQARILRTIGARKRAVIAGGAGTGKTLIAVEKTRQLAEEGVNVLFLCFNKPLAFALASNFTETPNVNVTNFHQLAKERIEEADSRSGRHLLNEAAAQYPGNGTTHMFEVQMPYAMALAGEVLTSKYDAIVVDEAQDFGELHWLGITDLLSDSNQSPFFLFTDENQAVFKRLGRLPISDEPFYLTANCRNTDPIHSLAYRFYKGEPVDPPHLFGPDVEFIGGETSFGQAFEITKKVSRWTSIEGISEEEIVVLVARWPKAESYETLSKTELPSRLKWTFEDLTPAPKSVRVETVPRFKGLEASAVILWLSDRVLEDKWMETLYVALSRAKSLLCIVCHPSIKLKLNCINQETNPHSA